MITKQDLEILIALRRKGRITLTEIGEQMHMPVSTIHTKLKHLSPFIEHHTTLVDFPSLGFGVAALAWFGCVKSKRQSMKQNLLNHPHINSIWEISEGYDFLVELITPSLGILEDVKDTLRQNGALHLSVVYVLENLARENLFVREASAATLRNANISLLRKHCAKNS